MYGEIQSLWLELYQQYFSYTEIKSFIIDLLQFLFSYFCWELKKNPTKQKQKTPKTNSNYRKWSFIAFC